MDKGSKSLFQHYCCAYQQPKFFCPHICMGNYLSRRYPKAHQRPRPLPDLSLSIVVWQKGISQVPSSNGIYEISWRRVLNKRALAKKFLSAGLYLLADHPTVISRICQVPCRFLRISWHRTDRGKIHKNRFLAYYIHVKI